ncbi:hypothetical protein WJX82_006686 [Trebouxia sp. C0006]
MDFFGDVFGSSASKAFIEGLNRVVGDGLSAQDWFAPKEIEETPVRLPWQPLTPEEHGYERQLRDAVLLISQSPQIFLQDASIAANQLPADILASAGAVLEADEGLRQLRFRLVPKYCSEEQFWNRYFAAVERVKQQVKTEQMWGDFDMLDSDGIEPSDPAGSNSRQVELPSMRQPANATDTMSNMASKVQAAEQRSERMVMSGDLGSQASSVTEALLMPFPNGHSFSGPCPHGPFSQWAMVKEPAAYGLCLYDPPTDPRMILPFKAAGLQQLADAALKSKRVETMWQLADQLGAITKPNSSDRAATAAWQLFNPMHVDAHTQICSASNEGEGTSLAGSIATAMCEMKDTAEMAMLWLEVMQEVECHWTSGHSLPDVPSARMSEVLHETVLNNCLAAVNAAIAVRQHSVHTAQAADVQGMAQQGSQALDKLQSLPPRHVSESAFTEQAPAHQTLPGVQQA